MTLAESWDAAAAGYEAYYVPRFAPWVTTAVDAVGEVPAGPVLVPCCGTFPELTALSERLPGREYVGIDLSPGMARLAEARAEGRSDVRVVVGDATVLEPNSAAAVVSVFGLQQLPDPTAALRSWVAALRPGGLLSVVFWPAVTETEGPFALLAELRGSTYTDDRVDLAGLDVERDELVSHVISHPDAATCFTAHTESGPLRPLLAARGAAFVAELRAEFLRRAPAGAWSHRPNARHIVVRGPVSP